MTLENALYFIAGGITGALLLFWYAGHRELLATFKRKLHNIWEPLTRNFGEKQEPEHKDAHADHVVVKKRKDWSID